ncbi:hypothetical protein AB0I77_26735 [Streptomyces sp. NPDC050619]|uniref:hypothetical protein n=1 Tax=Streptomyces sp. NPDC050619 TaxID=3157214 RepID=UPI003429E86E
MRWRSAVVTAAWVAVGTGAGGLGAWQLASADADVGAHGRALDDAAVRRALASAPETETSSATPSPSESPGSPGSPGSPESLSPSPSGSPRSESVRFTGGSAVVECRSDGNVYLVSWSPSDGYGFDDDVLRGPAPAARLEAEPSADDADDLTYEITCTKDGARAVRVADPDD